jgi:hypothetical protein
MRFLDCFFYEGSSVLFKVGLALLKSKSEMILRETEASKIMDMITTDVDPKLLEVGGRQYKNSF